MLTRRGALLASAGLVAACASPAPASPFDASANAFAADWVRLLPERATFSQFLPAAEQRALEREVTPRSDSRRERTLALARCGLGQPPIASR